MKAWPVVVLSLLAAAPAAAHPKQEAEILALINKRDVAGLKARSTLPFGLYGGVWFPDAKCAAFSNKAVKIDEAMLPLLVDCLANLGMRMDGWNAVYEPGAAIKLLVDDDGKLSGLAGTPTIDPKSPTIGSKALLAQVVGKAEVAPDAATKAAVDRSPNDIAWVRADVCVDASGAVDHVKVTEASSTHAAYRATVEKALRGWKLTPSRRGGKPVRVCASVTATYPDGKSEDEVERAKAGMAPPPPPPPPSVQNVAPNILEATRIAGDKLFTPDEDTKLKIQAAGKDRVVGSFKLCVSEAGDVKSVVALKSTGFLTYDQAIVTGINKWRYRPFLVDGKPVPVCTAVTFIYSQK